MNIAMIPGAKQSIASIVDITERVKAEKALLNNEERLRQLVETMNEGLSIITYINDKGCHLLQEGAPLKKALRFRSAF